jgi:CHAD domain-containing protein
MRRLSDHGFVAYGGLHKRREVFLDTFDWRLFAEAGCLVESASGSRRQLEWLSFPTGRCLATVRVAGTPRFAADLPEGVMAGQVRHFLDCRALVPLALRQLRWREFRLYDHRQKTVLRLLVEESAVERPEFIYAGAGERQALPAAIRLLPIKGYDEKLAQAVHWLKNELGLRPLDKGFPELVLQAAGHRPGSYSSKVDLKLSSKMTAEDATRVLLETLLKAQVVNEAGVTADIDSEFLHDFRVAIRRTRSALSQLKGVYPDEIMAPYRAAFGWLAGATGPTRDLDVYLLALPRYEQLLSPEFRPGLAALRLFIMRRRAEGFKKLKDVLASERYAKFKRQWHQFLTEESLMFKGPMSDIPAHELAGLKIWRLYKKLLKGGRAITNASPATDLHELRKVAKKLRYMFEFFKSLYGQEEVAAILKALKMLQQNLGDIQDYEVQADNLTDMASGLEKSGAGSAQAFMAIGMLTAHLMDMQAKARAEFAAVFAEFDSGKMHHLFCKLFKDDAVAGASTGISA